MAISPSTEDESMRKTVQSQSSGRNVAAIGCTAIPSSNEDSSLPEEEVWWGTLMQIAIPFLIAGIGTIGAGLVLGMVQHWPVFLEVSEFFILVPALLGLKGNLGMCLTSRLPTQTNLGNMEMTKQVWKIILGNITLVQTQATVAALLVSLFAVSVGSIGDGQFDFKHTMLLAASSLVTATSSCFILDFVMITIIILSHKFKMNPDNIATPLVASFGDLVSITLLSNVASLLHAYHETHYYNLFVIVACYLLMSPFWVWITHRNVLTRPVLKNGWVPVLSASLISGFGGLILDYAVYLFDGFVIFQPIINGIGGNLVSVQASHTSTKLHQTSLVGTLPPHAKICSSPWRALFMAPQAKTARILIGMSIPGQLLFIFVADYIYNSQVSLSTYFVLSYITVSVLQVMLLLYIAHILIYLMWKCKYDPENSAIPYITSLGDLLGSGLLTLIFIFLHAIGHDYTG